jgi:hypothetical protein
LAISSLIRLVAKPEPQNHGTAEPEVVADTYRLKRGHLVIWSSNHIALALIACLLLGGCGPSEAQLDATATAEVREANRQATAEAVSATAEAAAVFATAASLQSAATLVFGPEDVDLEHTPQNKLVPTYEYDADELRDIIVEATFIVPYDGLENPWDIGFLFRSTGEDDQLRLAVTSEGSWTLVRAVSGDPPSFEDLSDGALENLPTQAGEQITLRLVADGGQGALFLNGRLGAEFDLSAKTSAGSVMVATGLYIGDEQEGAVTKVQEFRVWKIEG